LLVREEHGAGFASCAPSSRRPELEPETILDWCQVHERIVLLGAERAAHEREVCRWLRAAERLAVHARAGHASLHEYAERVVGLSGRQVEERLRVAHALADLPGLDQTLASGALSWSAVRELTRIATPETEQDWLAWAKGRRSRQIEQAVAMRRPGDRPHDRPDPTLLKHRLRFEVRAETMAMFRDLQARVRADLGGDADDDAVLYEIARRALGGPTDDGRASYQVAVTTCPACGLASIDAGGQSHVVSQETAEMAACDCQTLGDAGSGGAAGQRPIGPDDCPHVGAPAAAIPARRATQSIPPAVRRLVKRRDHRRCVVPGCRNHRFLDVHHIVPLAEGGRHDPDQLCLVCGVHHSALHHGTLVLAGTARTGFTFRHADGTPYGRPPRPATVGVVEQVFGALRALGFSLTRARALIDAVLRKGAPDDPEAFLREALLAT
jgi:hypothetical protein